MKPVYIPMRAVLRDQAAGLGIELNSISGAGDSVLCWKALEVVEDQGCG